VTQARTTREKCEDLVRKHYYAHGWKHGIRVYEDTIAGYAAKPMTVVDVGCGRTFPMAEFLLARVTEAHGIELVAQTRDLPSGAYFRPGSAYEIPYPAATFDLVLARCVLEHLDQPAKALHEFARVLKPGGRAIFLTPNRYDYVSVFAWLIPNAWHGKVVRWTEGRAEADTFPTFYRLNSRRAIRHYAAAAGLEVEALRYHNNYPSSLMFSTLTCRLGIAYDKLVTNIPALHWLQPWLLGVLRKP